jgi:hypothetical protein
MEYSYEITPHSSGDGWQLRLLEDGQEVGGGVFPEDDGAGYEDANQQAVDWLDSRPTQGSNFYRIGAVWNCDFAGTSGCGATRAEALQDAKRVAADADEFFRKHKEKRAKLDAERPSIAREGEAALRRLFAVAYEHDSGGSAAIAAFLLSCYDGSRFPFDMREIRCLDDSHFND